MSDPVTILGRLATIEAEVFTALGLNASTTGHAYAEPPFSIKDTDLPTFINLPGPATDDWTEGDDEDYAFGFESRTYNILLFVAPSGTGIEGEAYAAAIPYLKAARDVFQSHQDLGGLGLALLTFQGDGGVRNDIPYAGATYTGTRFTVLVQERVRVKYATRE